MRDEVRDQIIWWGGNVSGVVIAIILYYGWRFLKSVENGGK
jgi:hypothetical protein